MKNLILIIFVMCTNGLLTAQTLQYHRPENDRHFYNNVDHGRNYNSYPDSIRIEMPEQNLIVVAEAKNFGEGIKVIGNLKKTLDELSAFISGKYSGKDEGSHRVDVYVDHNGFKNITITTKNDADTKIIVKDNQLLQLLPPGWEIYISDASYKIYIYAEKMAELSNVKPHLIDSVHTRLVNSKSFITGRKSVKARFVLQSNKVEYQNIQYAQPLDMLSLSASAGVGLLQNKLYPELTGSLGLLFADRFNRVSHRVELSYSSMYFQVNNSEGKSVSNISSFLNISYSKNFGKVGKPAHWTGLGAGLLVHETNDFFKGKTAKFFIITNFGNTQFSLIPEFYLTDDFKKFQYGLKLHYRF